MRLSNFPVPDKNIEMGIFWDDEGFHHYHPLRRDVQAILTILGSRDDDLIAFEKERLFEIDLTKADLTGARLVGLNMTGVVLASASMSDSDLRCADLSGAVLRSAVLCDARLQGADLRGTTLFAANLSDTSFVGDSPSRPRVKIYAQGLKQEDLFFAFFEPGRPPELDGLLDPDTGRPITVTRVVRFPDD